MQAGNNMWLSVVSWICSDVCQLLGHPSEQGQGLQPQLTEEETEGLADLPKDTGRSGAQLKIEGRVSWFPVLA